MSAFSYSYDRIDGWGILNRGLVVRMRKDRSQKQRKSAERMRIRVKTERLVSFSVRKKNPGKKRQRNGEISNVESLERLIRIDRRAENQR